MSGRLQKTLSHSKNRKYFYIILSLLILTGFSAVLLRNELLPERFDGDARSIAIAAEMVEADASAEYIDRYYTNTGRIYGSLRLADKPMLVGVIGYMLVAGLTMTVLWRWRPKSDAEAWGALAVSGVVLGLSAVYLGTLSKDIFGVILVVAPLVIGGRKKWGWPACLVGAIIFGVVFRSYFVVVALVALGYSAIMHVWRPRVWQWLGIVAMTVIAGVVGYYLVTGTDISIVREINNADRVAASMMPNMVGTGSVGSGIINSLLTGVLMVIPLPLIAAGGLYHFGAAILMVALVGLGVWLLRENNLQKKVSVPLALVMGLFTVQCLFEPDLGSVLRHWTMLGVVMLAAFCAVRGKYEQA